MDGSYLCPFCEWPYMKIITTPAIDGVGNQYKHAKCKCGAEAIFLLKENRNIEIQHPE